MHVAGTVGLENLHRPVVVARRVGPDPQQQAAMHELVFHVLDMPLADQMGKDAAQRSAGPHAERRGRDRRRQRTARRSRQARRRHPDDIHGHAQHRPFAIATGFARGIGDGGRARIVLQPAHLPVGIAEPFGDGLRACQQAQIGAVETGPQQRVDGTLEIALAVKHADRFREFRRNRVQPVHVRNPPCRARPSRRPTAGAVTAIPPRVYGRSAGPP